MKKQIAMFCCLMVIQSSVVIAGEPGSTAPTSAASVTPHTSVMGPLGRASLNRDTWKTSSDSTWSTRQDPAPASDPDTRSWMERHPVWTGALVGFAAGSAITYLAVHDTNKTHELFDFSGYDGAAVLVFGGVSAGIGALAGWGIGRSQHDGYHNRARTVAPAKRTK